MTQVILLMDVGGTNTRAKIIPADQEISPDNRIIAERTTMISTKTALLDFISNLLSDYKLKNKLSMAVLCFAGSVTEHTHVVVTNWPDQRDITFTDLVQCGLPPESTLLVNDMEAAAWSLLDRHHSDNSVNLNTIPFYTVANNIPAANNNMVLLMPGTGMGVASIVAGDTSGRPHDSFIIAAEIQHSAIPALDTEHANLIDVFSKHLGKDHISWEDFISGNALENIHSALKNVTSTTGESGKWDNKLTADAIAEQAILNGDAVCRSALSIYYRCIGALAQVLALTLQPFAGIYLMGRTTKQNLSFIPQSGFLQELQDNKTQGELLKKFPVYLITEDLNLDGATCIARQHLQDTNQFSLFA